MAYQKTDMANKKLSAIINIGGAISSTLGSAFDAVRKKTDNVGDAVRKLTERERELNRELARVGRNGQNGSELRVQYAREELLLIGKQLTALRQREAQEKRITDNQKNRDKLQGKIGGAFAATAVVAAPSIFSLKHSAEFNYQMQMIGNTASMTKAEIGDLGKQIMTISKQTGKSSQDVQAAMGYLIAAGLDASKSADYLKAIGKTATASGAEIEDVSKSAFTLSDTLKIAIGPDRVKNAQDMQRALEMLVIAGNSGHFEFKDMAGELPNLAAGMQALKMTGSEAVATLGAALQIARKTAGTPGEAATNMENFIAKVLSPETLKKAQKSFGVDLYKIITTAQKNGKNPFEAAIEAINKMTKGGDQKLLGDLFADMQVQSFVRPMLQHLGEYKAIKSKIFNETGVVERQFNDAMDTSKKKMDDASNAAGRLSIAIGTSLEPAIGKLLDRVTPFLDSLSAFTEKNQGVVGSAILLVGGLFGLNLATLATTLTLNVFKGSLLQLKGGMLRAGAALMTVSRGVLFLGRALLLNPIGLAITAIGTAAFLIYKYWEPIKGFFLDLWSGVKSAFSSAYEWIVGKLAYVLDLAVHAKNTVTGMFSSENTKAKIYGSTSARGGAAPLPTLPTVSGRGGAVITDNSQVTINVQQQQGQDSKALVLEIERKLRERQGVRNRSVMFDGVVAQ
jgi:TP901 family phage tail tape measure protein